MSGSYKKRVKTAESEVFTNSVYEFCVSLIV